MTLVEPIAEVNKFFPAILWPITPAPYYGRFIENDSHYHPRHTMADGKFAILWQPAILWLSPLPIVVFSPERYFL